MAAKPPRPRGPQLELAGDLCVAFVNTAGARKKNRQQAIESYLDLIAWGQAVSALSSREAERLGRLAAEQPAQAESVWNQAKELRSALFRLFLAVMKEDELPADDLAPVNDALRRTLANMRLVPGEKGLKPGWLGDEDALDLMLWPVVHAASQLLLSLEGRPYVRQCAAARCRLFFVDRTPKGKRKWCEQICANRTKSLRFYYRQGRADRMKAMDKLHGPGRRRRRPNKSR